MLEILKFPSSAFFATTLHIIPVYAETFTESGAFPDAQDILSASFQTPIMQKRRVLLQCSGRTVCTATSLVRMTSPRSAQLLLEEKFAIGQMFQKLDKSPQFELLSVGFGSPSNEDKAETGQALWRRYKLSVPDFECEILEEFPSREMFVRGQDWLVGNPVEKERSTKEIVLSLLLALVAAFELLMFMNGSRSIL